MARRRKHTGRLSLEDRLRLLRNGLLSSSEAADLASDLGMANYIEAMADVEKLLDHPSGEVRYEALGTLAYEGWWGQSSESGRIVEMALSDPDPECRRQAAGALGSLFRQTRKKEILLVLDSIARNNLEEDDIRAFAYTAALDVIGVPRSRQPNPCTLMLGQDDLVALEEYMKDSLR